MTSSVPNPADLASGVDEGHQAERAIGDAMARLEDLREIPLAEHVERFEHVHATLTDALNKAENLLSHGSGS